MEDMGYVIHIARLGVPGAQQSFVISKSALQVQPSGMYFDPNNVVTTGYMKWEKLCELLPYEYSNQ
jgi:hypothetical protein